MSRILYLKASPRRENSVSIAVADAFLEAYKEKNPGDEVISVNLFDKDLVAFDGNTMQGKYNILHGKEYTPEEKKAWETVENEIEDFKAADKYVFALAMWNFSIPYRLKHYIDIIVQPAYTFSYSPEEGFTGLVTGKPAFLSYARGNAYPAGSEMEPMDMQSTYMEKILRFIGFSEIRSVVVEPTLADPDTAGQKKAEAVEKAKKIADSF
jgi:FMN-dependent NADH-azoreductase